MKVTHSNSHAATIESNVFAQQRSSKPRTKTRSWFAKRSLLVRVSLWTVNLAILGIVGLIVFGGSKPSTDTSKFAAVTPVRSTPNPLDPVSSSDIATTVAKMTSLPETTSVVNQAQSADVAATIHSSEVGITEKPSVLGTALKSKADIISYVTQAGDTISSLAQRFNVTSDSIRLSNNLTGDTVPPGKQLFISPISNGLVYTVKEGDTTDSLAQKFHANKDKIAAFNDAEVKGLTVGDHVVIPDGTVIPQSAIPTFAAVGTGFAFGGSAPIYSIGATGYDFGQCTYYAALRRSQMGSPIPSNLGNAVTWVQLAQLAGLSTGNMPRKGAVIWTPPSKLSSYYARYGHVGFVEEVLPDGTVRVSDMNVKGWDVVSSRTLTPELASEYTYIY